MASYEYACIIQPILCGHSINIPVPYFSFKLPQVKFENDKYRIDEAYDFQGLKKNEIWIKRSHDRDRSNDRS